MIRKDTTRRTELTERLDQQPKPPSPEAVDQLRRDLAHVLDHGTPGQKKAIIGTHVAEIQTQGTQLIPIYKIPTDENGPAGTPADPTISRNTDVVDILRLEFHHQRRTGRVRELADPRHLPVDGYHVRLGQRRAPADHGRRRLSLTPAAAPSTAAPAEP